MEKNNNKKKKKKEFAFWILKIEIFLSNFLNFY